MNTIEQVFEKMKEEWLFSNQATSSIELLNYAFSRNIQGSMQKYKCNQRLFSMDGSQQFRDLSREMTILIKLLICVQYAMIALSESQFRTQDPISLTWIENAKALNVNDAKNKLLEKLKALSNIKNSLNFIPSVDQISQIYKAMKTDWLFGNQADTYIEFLKYAFSNSATYGILQKSACNKRLNVIKDELKRRGLSEEIIILLMLLYSTKHAHIALMNTPLMVQNPISSGWLNRMITSFGTDPVALKNKILTAFYQIPQASRFLPPRPQSATASHIGVPTQSAIHEATNRIKLAISKGYLFASQHVVKHPCMLIVHGFNIPLEIADDDPVISYDIQTPERQQVAALEKDSILAIETGMIVQSFYFPNTIQMLYRENGNRTISPMTRAAFLYFLHKNGTITTHQQMVVQYVPQQRRRL